MSDIFDDTFPNSVTFTTGEQPSHAKFTGWATQTDGGMRLLDRAIGDVWGEEKQTRTGADFTLSTWSDRPLNIANLARLIGPASALNPNRLGTKSILVTFSGSDIPAGVHEFQLPEPSLIINQTGRVFTINIDVGMAVHHLGYQLDIIDPGVFGTHQDARDDCTSNGDYHVDTQGRVYCYQVTGTYADVLRRYYTDMLWDTYSMSRMNVIPDINETTTLCTVSAAASNKQLIVLPIITDLPGYDDDGTTRTLPGTPSARAYLPYAITSTLSNGDTIPEGLVYLWDTDTGEICTNDDGDFIVFNYYQTGRLYAVTTNLEACSDRYRLITVGTTITETLGELVHNFRVHEHTIDSRQGQPVDHGNLSGLLMSDEEVDDAYSEDWGGFRHSNIGSNDHPQYLMRYGWDDGLDPPNQDNAMLGALFMGTYVSSYKDIDDYRSAAQDSHPIYFGSTDVYIEQGDGDLIAAAFGGGNFNFANSTFGVMPTQATGADPAGGTPESGAFIFDTNNKKLYIYDGASWLETAALS